MTMDLADVLFIDVEASGLASDSYPIEVGWADIEGWTGAVLIKPADTWTYWDEEAERLHCISRVRLAEKGMAADAAAILVAKVFAERDSVHGRGGNSLLAGGGHRAGWLEWSCDTSPQDQGRSR